MASCFLLPVLLKRTRSSRPGCLPCPPSLLFLALLFLCALLLSGVCRRDNMDFRQKRTYVKGSIPMRYPLKPALLYCRHPDDFYDTDGNPPPDRWFCPCSRCTAAGGDQSTSRQTGGFIPAEGCGPWKKEALPHGGILSPIPWKAGIIFSRMEIPVPAGTQVGDQVKIRYAVHFPDMIVERSFPGSCFCRLSPAFFLLGFWGVDEMDKNRGSLQLK